MSKNYEQLNIKERELIQLGLWEKKSLREIAEELGRSPSTIAREIKKNVPPLHQRRYTPRLANARAVWQRTTRHKRPRLKAELIRQYVAEKLQLYWSPEQIAGRLPLDHPGYSISHEAIYLYIYSQYYREGYGACKGRDLRIYLRRKHKRRKRKKLLYPQEQGRIPQRIMIRQRPKYIEKRVQQGHWEGDAVESRQSLEKLNTLVERASGIVLISKLPNGTKQATTDAVIQRLKTFPLHLRRTLTLDNGKENAGHLEITKSLGTKCYFCNPYHAWEKGTNENTNGLIRFYLPKKTDFATVTEEQINAIELALNTRPRKRLKYKTPIEVFNQGVAVDY